MEWVLPQQIQRTLPVTSHENTLWSVELGKQWPMLDFKFHRLEFLGSRYHWAGRGGKGGAHLANYR